MIAAPEQDHSLGMEFYFTDASGCGGVIKSRIEDFLVDEVYQNFKYEGGRYLVLEVEKKNWDTHHLIRELSRRLHISQKRFSWAGTKDKRAVTRQRISIMSLDESEIQRISIPDVKLTVLGRTNRCPGLGDLIGNKFKIRIRNIACQDPELSARRITEEIAKAKGIPNFFGLQRFGDIRPITHKVGQALVHGEIEEAVFLYLAWPFPREPEHTRQARQMLWDFREIGEALKSYPDYLSYELAMLNHLVQRPGDFAGSFNALPLNLRRMFVHAYQSYIFNRILSRRLLSGYPLDRAIEGDVVCFTKGDLPSLDRLQQVTSDNLEAVNRLADRGRCYVTLPLFGYNTRLASGSEGNIEKEILKAEGVSGEDFRISANPALGSPGTRRAALVKVNPQVSIKSSYIEMEFFLPAGSYATVVLREYMKTVNLIEKQPNPP